MGLLENLASAPKEGRTLQTVTDFRVSVESHTSKTTGQKSFGFKVAPVLSDGSTGRFGDLWIRLDTPDALRAFVNALPRIAKTAAALDAKMVEAGEWQAPTKASQTVAAPQKKMKDVRRSQHAEAY